MSHASGGTREIDARLAGGWDRTPVAITRLIERRHETLVSASTVIERSAIDIYAFWRDPANLPHVIPQLDRVIALNAARSLWIGCKPSGRRTQRVCTLVHDTPGRVIAWEAEGVSLIGSRRLSLTRLSDCSTRVTLTSVLPPAPASTAAPIGSPDHCAPVLRSMEVLGRLRESLRAAEPVAVPPLCAPLFDRLAASLGHRLGLVRA